MKESIFLKNHIDKLHNTVISLQSENEKLKKENDLLKSKLNNQGFWKKLSNYFNGSTTFEIHLNSKKEKNSKKIETETLDADVKSA